MGHTMELLLSPEHSTKVNVCFTLCDNFASEGSYSDERGSETFGFQLSKSNMKMDNIGNNNPKPNERQRSEI